MSRETRQLLTTALLALVALWVLARVRFPDQPVNPNPIPTLLSQLSPIPRFANLAGEIADLQDRLAGSWFVIPATQAHATGEVSARTLPALRFRSGSALVLLVGGAQLREQDIVAADRATGLAVIRAGASPSSLDLTPWMPASLDTPRYLMATSATPAGVSLRPVLVGSLHQTSSPAWSGPIWAVPDGTDLDPGAFVFTTAGELAGLVVQEPAGPAIVPGAVLTADAEWLLERGPTTDGDLRVTVQPLTHTLTKATGASSGVVVAWVDPQGPAAGVVVVGDVIETLNGEPVASVRDWDVLASRLPPGGANLRVHRQSELRDVHVMPVAPNAALIPSSLGLTLQSLPSVGTSVVAVEAGSAAEAAGLQKGDVITLVGRVSAPTPSDVRTSFESARAGDAILVALTRGQSHRVLAVVK